MAHPPFKIFLNRRPVEAPSSPMTGAAILGLGGYGSEYELYELQGEGDPTGGVQIVQGAELPLKDGLHFRAIPGNANFG
jgi:hypothetical protein